MKKILSVLVSVVLVGQMLVLPINAAAYGYDVEMLPVGDLYDENNIYGSAIYEAMDCLYIYPFAGTSYFGKTYWDSEVKNMDSFLQLILPTFRNFAEPPYSDAFRETIRRANLENYDTTLMLVYRRKTLETAIDAKFGKGFSAVLNPNDYMIQYMDNDYVLTWESARGQTYPGSDYVIDDVSFLNDTTLYCKWHVENIMDKAVSEPIYSILQNKTLEGKTIVGYEYLSVLPPSEELLHSFLPISVTCDGVKIEFDVPPVTQNDRTLVPLRAIFEALGATVEWDDAAQTVTARRNGVTIKLTIGDYCFYKNGSRIDMDAAAILMNDRTLVPVRAVSEAFGCKVDWDEKTKTVGIQKANLSDSGDILMEFLHTRFEQTPLTMQSDAYSTIEEDNQYSAKMQTVISYKFLDIDDDGTEELLITSEPESGDTYVPQCFSVWDCDTEGNVVCALAKCGQQSRGAYRYFVIQYQNEIYLLESMGVTNSAAHTSIRNLYRYNGEKLRFEAKDKIFFRMSYDLSFDSDEIFIVNGENQSKESVGNYIDEIDSSRFLYRQFDDEK